MTPGDDQTKKQDAQTLREGRAVTGAFLAILTGMTGGYAAGIDTASAAPWIAVPAVAGLTSLFSRIAGKGAAIGIKDPETAESVSNVVQATILASSLIVAFFSFAVTSSSVIEKNRQCPDAESRVLQAPRP